MAVARTYTSTEAAPITLDESIYQPALTEGGDSSRYVYLPSFNFRGATEAQRWMPQSRYMVAREGLLQVLDVDGHDKTSSLTAVDGTGSDASVLFGYDRQTGDRIAVKIFDSLIGIPEAEFRERSSDLRRRFSMMERLSKHAGLLFPYDLIYVRDATGREIPAFIYKRAEGGTCFQRFVEAGKSRRLGVEEVLDIAEQVAEALDALHAQGWCHCDVSTDNLFLMSEGGHLRVVVGDMEGMVPYNRPSKLILRYRAGYAPPEVLQGNFSRIGPQSDQYSLAVCIYELLSARSIRHTVESQQYTLPRHVQHLQTILNGAFVSNPQRRYRNCRQLVSLLKRGHEAVR